MGAKQSGQARSVNIENQTPIGVLDVSEDVVKRLKNGLMKNEQANQTNTSKMDTTSTLSHSTTSTKYVPVLYNEPSISSMDVQRLKEVELQQNDLYWRKRMVQLEQTLNKTNAVMEKEYSLAIDDVRKSFSNAPPTHQLPPCQTLKANLIACYRANPGEALKCSEEVNNFMNCISENRVKKLDEKASNKKPVQNTEKDSSLPKAA